MKRITITTTYNTLAIEFFDGNEVTETITQNRRNANSEITELLENYVDPSTEE